MKLSPLPLWLMRCLLPGSFTVLLVMAGYLMVRTALFLLSDYAWHEKIVAGALLLAETFILVHGVGYFLNVIHVLRRPPQRPPDKDSLPDLPHYPPVAIVVSSFREPLEVVEANLICFRNLTYPNKRIYFLDDTRYDQPSMLNDAGRAYRSEIDRLCRETGVNLFRRRWHGAKAGMLNDFLDFIAGRHKEGFAFSNFQNADRTEPEKYIIVFDADMNPLPDFVEELVEILEANPRLAFVQTPQYYTNFETNRVARAAGLQQAIFYEYICEGKSGQDAMFCCGTNVAFRREAFEDVGGFDDTSVTEDFATSLKFHLRGWSSAYLNKVCAFGMGPNDLGGYFKQQFRWALGTVGLFRDLVRRLCTAPRSLRRAKWWEYLLSGTHYFVGWTFLVLWACPVLYLFFGIPRHLAHPEVFLAAFFPYLLLTFTFFILTLRQRSYRLGETFSGLLLTTISFPVYIKASTLALFGFRGSFGITPKQGSTSLPLKDLWPQILCWALAFASVVWGLHHLYYARVDVASVAVNTAWSAYNCLILSTVFYFNRPEADPGG